MIHPFPLNERVYKKRAKAARDELIRRYGFEHSDFDTVRWRGDVVWWREVSRVMVPVYPLRGTPVVYRPDGNDVDCPVETLLWNMHWDVSKAQYARRKAKAEKRAAEVLAWLNEGGAHA